MQRRQYAYLVINQDITLQMAGSLDCFPFYSFVGLNRIKIMLSLGVLARRFYAVVFFSFLFKFISNNIKTQQSSCPCCLHPTKFKVLFCSCAQLHLSSYQAPLQKNSFFYLFELTCCALYTPRGKCMPFRHLEAACPHHFHSLLFESQSNCM